MPLLAPGLKEMCVCPELSCVCVCAIDEQSRPGELFTLVVLEALGEIGFVVVT